MTWKINFTKEAYKFLEKNHFPKEKILKIIEKVIEKFQGENINVDIKKLKGNWLGFHRIRKGKLRIIAKFNFNNSLVLIEVIDWRGDVYK